MCSFQRPGRAAKRAYMTSKDPDIVRNRTPGVPLAPGVLEEACTSSYLVDESQSQRKSDRNKSNCLWKNTVQRLQEVFVSSSILPFLNFGFPYRKQFYFWEKTHTHTQKHEPDFADPYSGNTNLLLGLTCQSESWNLEPKHPYFYRVFQSRPCPVERHSQKHNGGRTLLQLKKDWAIC